MQNLLRNRYAFHLLAFFALVIIHFPGDYHAIQQRSGIHKYSPYFFLLLLYGWIVFHNLVLFDGLFLTGRKRAYFRWTGLAMSLFSLNMYIILLYVFDAENPHLYILNFWIYTLLGLGVYMIYRYLQDIPKKQSQTRVHQSPGDIHFKFTMDGVTYQLSLSNIIYVESLENYIKIYTKEKTYITRIPMKEAEQRLPTPFFLRVSRSHILNTRFIQKHEADILYIADQQFKIGKVYKKYVEEYLSAPSFSQRSF